MRSSSIAQFPNGPHLPQKPPLESRRDYLTHRVRTSWAERQPPPSDKRAPKPATKNREDHAWFFSHLFFGYFFPIIWRGLRRPLETEDLWEVHSLDRADVVHEKLKKAWTPKYLQYQADLAKFEAAKRAHAAQVAALPQGAPVPAAPVQPKKPSFISALMAVGGWRLAWAGFLSALQTAAFYIGPLTLMPLIESIFYLRNNIPHDFPYHWAVLYILAPFLSALAQSQSERIMFHAANQMRTAMMTAVYEKVLHLNNASSSQTDSGQMITLISADARQATEWLHMLHMGWTTPLSLIASLVLVFNTIKWAGGPPLGLMILVLPLQAIVSAKMMSSMTEFMNTNDERIKVTNETIQGIKVVKFSGLEDKFSDRMRASQAKQSSPAQHPPGPVLHDAAVPGDADLHQRVGLRLVCPALPGRPARDHLLRGLAQIAASMNRVGDFMLLPEKGATESAAALPAQTSDETFVSVRGATFKWAEPPTVPPPVMEGYIRASVARQLMAEWKRQAKQAAKEKRPLPPRPPVAAEIPASVMAPMLAKAGLPTKKGVTITPEEPAPSTSPDGKSAQLSKSAQLLASCQRAQAAEAAEAAARHEQPATLREISFDVPRGSLTMVVGPVGSGKSSLAAALIGEITRVSGDVVVGGTLSYCAQQAWITNATVRENILFGLPFDEERYRRAVEVCALEPDFKIMAAGDQTAIGEKGVNLSGGQKQRISLARSVYSDREIYLWDDPLSAVDVHVGKHIFERCIRGQLRGRTMILITNQLQYLEQADQVVILKDGAIEAKGSYADLRSRGFDFSKYVVKAEEAESKREAAMKIISDEEHSTGAIPWRLYFSYLGTYSGLLGWLGMIALFVITEGAGSVSSWWLQQWTGGAYLSILGPFYYPILIYAMIGVAQSLIAFVRSLFWVNVSIRGDLSQVDLQMSMLFENCFNMYLGTLAMLVVVGIGSWWFFVILVPIVVVFYLLQAVYRRTSREVQRLESISRSPCFAHFAETLMGLPTLRSYGLVDKWVGEFWTKCDQYSSAFMMYRLGQKWMGLYQSLVSSCILAAAVLLYTFTDVGADFLHCDTALTGLACSLPIPERGRVSRFFFCSVDPARLEWSVSTVNPAFMHASYWQRKWMRHKNKQLLNPGPGCRPPKLKALDPRS
ncbi:Multidrug resistance-associated protein [Paratrimastix pyriformis]|uniref:Multidrug resistance-associated protein n=1 Tax=Paratrimastix pyriformis TaxID=342808 RepID=A0ABQ8URN4_9EUKA|nr:Multidrug resistance-associated protein [Paratrimastix pyriformis]